MTVIRMPSEAIAILDVGIARAVETVATTRHDRILAEADDLLCRAAEFREYVRSVGRDEPLMTLMREHAALFPTHSGDAA